MSANKYSHSEPDLSAADSHTQSTHSAEYIRTIATETITTTSFASKGDHPTSELNTDKDEPDTCPAQTDPPDMFGELKQRMLQYRRYWPGIAWAMVTMYFIAGLAARQMTLASDLLPFIFMYVFISGRIAVYYFPTRLLKSRRAGYIWSGIALKINSKLSTRMQYVLSSSVLLALSLIVSLSLPIRKGESRLARMQSFLGIVVITATLVATSRNRHHINWRTVIVGYSLQFFLGCIVMKTHWGNSLFTWLANAASGFLAFSRFGAALFFGDNAVNSGVIAITMFPVIIFFASFVQVMYYLGAVQWLLQHIGWFIYKALGTSGAEAIVASASPFVGQSENMLLVKEYLEHMTNSELHACMTAGFATISGSVFQAYVMLGVDAKSLITACIMSIPCSLALSKIRYPETEEPLTRGRVVLSERKKETNILHALGNGAATGIQLSLLILATIIAMVSLIYATNFMLTWLGQFIGIHSLTLELVLGYLLYPLTWLLGVPSGDVLAVSKLLGLKLVANEFIAYSQLTGAAGMTPVQDQLSSRGLMIAQFALAGFANTGSIAQIVAVIGNLAPSRKGDVAKIVFSACITGAIATMLTAAIVSMIV